MTKDMIELTETEAKALASVVSYNWSDERADWERQDEEGRKRHIFNDLTVLDGVLRQAKAKPSGDVAEMLDRFTQKRRDVAHQTAELALTVLAIAAREASSDASTLVLDWSDQGDYLCYADLRDAEGNSLAVDFDEDAELAASHLDESTGDVWEPLVKGGYRRRAGGGFEFDIEQLLTELNQEEKG